MGLKGYVHAFAVDLKKIINTNEYLDIHKY